MQICFSLISKEHIELINILLSQATTIEEKYHVLDARDKLLRIKLKKGSYTKSGPTSGICTDMCPEKERLMRVTKHQVMTSYRIKNLACFLMDI